MDAWPGYCDEQSAAPAKAKGKAKAQDKRVERPWCYPVIDHGSLAAATLSSKGKRYEWMFGAGNPSEYQLVASNGPVEVLPPICPQQPLDLNITSLQRAKQGALFLRTYYPDVDIPLELLRDEITEDDKFRRALRFDDPFGGNTMDVSSFQHSRKNMDYLAFPMGETKRQLGMSPLITNPSFRLDSKPLVMPVHTFETPIRQIVASPRATESGKGKIGPILGVRTMGSVHFLQVKLIRSRPARTVETPLIISLKRSDVGDRHAVDLAIPSERSAVGYIANETGDLFRCGLVEDKSIIERVYATNHTDRILCRIAACDGRGGILATWDNTASLLDLRAGHSPYKLYTVPQTGTKLTSIESLGEDRIIRLISTDEILWLDERNTRRPLIAVKHGREFDTTLHSRTQVLAHGPLTFLTSLRNSLITVYDVSRGVDSSDKLVRMYGTPYALPPILRPDGPHLGYAYFQQPTLAGSKHLSIIQLSQRGSISVMNLDHVPADVVGDASSHTSRLADWPRETGKTGEEANSTRLEQSPLASRAHSIVDLGVAYDHLFVERKAESLTAQSDVVLDLIERMSEFWQIDDAPVEHSLTMYDIALRSGPEPSETTRNDWLSGSPLDSVAGYRMLTLGRIPRKQLIERSPWHLDIAPFIHRQVVAFDRNLQKVLQHLARYDLADGLERTADSFRRESEARSQLALDLSLAADVFTSYHPGKDAAASFDDDMLCISLSTQAMSLGDLEPPPVQFNFIHPVRKNHPSSAEVSDERTKARKTTVLQSITPQGVRLLMQEWELGTDPAQYVYQDPYDDTSDATLQAPRTAKVPTTRGLPEKTILTPVPAQRPPTIASSLPQAPPVTAATQATAPRKLLVAARSQDAIVAQSRFPNVSSQRTDAGAAPQSSQGLIASTQVLPGPHGGRPLAAKKKPKKRRGGF